MSEKEYMKEDFDEDKKMKFHRTLPIQWRRYNWYYRKRKLSFGKYNLFKCYRRRIVTLSPKPSRYILWNS